jgi:hypothetical protein
MFLVSPQIVRWDVLLPGLAWRVWLLGYGLPLACALWSNAPATTRKELA